jgi:predicted metal-dependent hydrolase
MSEAYTLIRSTRRTVGLQLGPSGELLVRAPKRMSDAEVTRIIARHALWIERARRRLELRPIVTKHTFAPGSTLPFLGHTYTLAYSQHAKVPVELTDVFTLQTARAMTAKATLTAWYKDQARTIFTARVQLYAAKHGLNVQRLRISSAKSRWGSCSGHGSISLVWRLILAPLPVLDYVVCHELAHLRHHNHGRQFWMQVAAMQPNYELYRQWLRQHGYQLQL